MNSSHRLVATCFLITLGLVPAVLAIAVYAAIGVLAGIAAAMAAGVEVVHAAATGFAKRVRLADARSA